MEVLDEEDSTPPAAVFHFSLTITSRGMARGK